MSRNECPCCGTTMLRKGRWDTCPDRDCGARLRAGWQIRVPHAREIVERAEKMQATASEGRG